MKNSKKTRDYKCGHQRWSHLGFGFIEAVGYFAESQNVATKSMKTLFWYNFRLHLRIHTAYHAKTICGKLLQKDQYFFQNMNFFLMDVYYY